MLDEDDQLPRLHQPVLQRDGGWRTWSSWATLRSAGRGRARRVQPQALPRCAAHGEPSARPGHRDIFPTSRRSAARWREVPVAADAEYMEEWVKEVPTTRAGRPMACRARRRLRGSGRGSVFRARAPAGEKDRGRKLDPETGISPRTARARSAGGWPRGFRTPSRKMEIAPSSWSRPAATRTRRITARQSKGKNRPDYHAGHENEVSPWPKYMEIAEHQ